MCAAKRVAMLAHTCPLHSECPSKTRANTWISGHHPSIPVLDIQNINFYR